MLLSLIAYATTRDAPGLVNGIGFIKLQSEFIGQQYGALFQHLFLWMGVAILLTTELGLLDACARISTDIIKVNWLRDNPRWTDNRLYFLLLWIQVGLGCGIMLIGLVVPGFTQPLVLLVFSASLNGCVMLIYSVLLLQLNVRVLGGCLRMPLVRRLAILWSCAFFGYFTVVTLIDRVPELFE